MRAWLMLALLIANSAFAGDGRLLGSGGLGTLDGAAGGGMLPWAVIAGHGERRQWDWVASSSYIDTGEFDLRSHSVAIGWDNRLELSFARLSLGLDALVNAGLFPNQRLDTDILAAKLRLGGDFIYGPAPQVALGLQWRRSRDADLVRFASADDDQGFDVYLNASKLWIDGIASLRTIASLGVRSTDANQLGLAGFSDQRTLTWEGSLAVFVHPHWLVGAEYRSKPDRLVFASEDDWSNVFIAWLPSRQWHLALAYADLGSIGGFYHQRGFYLSVQGSP